MIFMFSKTRSWQSFRACLWFIIHKDMQRLYGSFNFGLGGLYKIGTKLWILFLRWPSVNVSTSKIINYNDYDNNYSLIVIITCVDWRRRNQHYLVRQVLSVWGLWLDRKNNLYWQEPQYQCLLSEIEEDDNNIWGRNKKEHYWLIYFDLFFFFASFHKIAALKKKKKKRKKENS